MAKKAKAKALDFSNVKERGAVSPTHRPEGDYLGKVMSVEDIQMGAEKRDAWLFVVKIGAGTYAYRCGFNENELWKIRNLHVAAGVPVPKKRQTIDPNRVVGKNIGCTLQDNWYDKGDGSKPKLNSEIAAVFPPSELDGSVADDGGDYDEDETGQSDFEDEAPAKAKKGKKAQAEPEPAPKKKGKKGKKMESLDIEDL